MVKSMNHSIKFLLIGAALFLIYTKLLIKYSIGLRSYANTTPMPILEALVSTLKTLSKLGRANIGFEELETLFLLLILIEFSSIPKFN